MHLLVTDREGIERQIEGQAGRSVMNNIRAAGIDELLALCGGCLSCGTCHVYVDPEFAGLLPPLSPEEDDLLDSLSDREENSRLSCQLPFTAALEGLRVTIAPED